MTFLYLDETQTFEALVSQMPQAQADEYKSLKHNRIEIAFRDRRFVVYNMENRLPICRGLIEVVDFVCDDLEGCTTLLRNVDTGDEVTVGHQPTKLFDWPVFVSIPVYPRLMYSLPAHDSSRGFSLAFPLLMKTRSRRHLREKGITYCETLKSYREEFEKTHPNQGVPISAAEPT